MNRAEHTSTIVEVNEEMRDFMYCIETQPVFEDVLRRTNTRTTERMHIVNKRIKCMRLEHRIVTTLDNGATIYGEWTPVAGTIEALLQKEADFARMMMEESLFDSSDESQKECDSDNDVMINDK
ncbi:hypothetical protein EMCRGX_G002593 [Ephydatia muelleri]